MKSIYASKLYIASKRKDKISAAMLAPSNLALMQQLADDLDEEYKTKENLGLEEDSKSEDASAEDNEFNEFIVDEDVDPSKDLVTMDDLGKSAGGGGHRSSSGPKSSSGKPDSDKDDGPKEKSDTSDLMPESPANEQPEKPEASTHMNNTLQQIKSYTIADLNLLKNTLNSRKETAGVIRIAEKENEIWIYYNDDINLNDIMVDVIESITTSDTPPAEFNRLARSDNAIVFVTVRSTPIEPAEESSTTPTYG